MSPSFAPNWLSGAPAFVLCARRVSSPRDLSYARISLTVMATIIRAILSKASTTVVPYKWVVSVADSCLHSQDQRPPLAARRLPSIVLEMLLECVQRRGEVEAFFSALCHSTCHRRWGS